jgi:glycosyltransferase involved in cell wall biosynthesis
MYLLTRNDFTKNSLFYLSSINNPNGSEKNVLEIYNATKSRYLLLDEKPYLSNVSELATHCKYISYYSLRKLIKIKRPKIFTVSYQNSIKMFLALLFFKYKFILIFRHSIESYKEIKCISYLLFLNLFKKKIIYIIYNSHAAEITNGFYLNVKSKIIYNPKRFSKIEKIHFKKRKYDLIFIARNHPDKNPELFFKVANQLLNQNKKLKILVIGDFKKISKNVKNLKCIQYTKNIDYYLNNSRIILITSKTESLPNVLVEAINCSAIPIAPNIGDIPLFMNDNRFIHNYSANEISNQILGTLQMDLNEIKKTQINNKLKLLKKFNSKNYLEYT